MVVAWINQTKRLLASIREHDRVTHHISVKIDICLREHGHTHKLLRNVWHSLSLCKTGALSRKPAHAGAIETASQDKDGTGAPDLSGCARSAKERSGRNRIPNE